jgi:putative colanic acid biosysnthesis UDP-glucose lipid carrier transferase
MTQSGAPACGWGEYRITPETELRHFATSEPRQPSIHQYPQRLLRDRQSFVHWIQWLTSAALVLGLLFVLTQQHLGDFPVEYRFLAVTTGMLMLVVYQSVGVFRRFNTRASGMLRLTKAWGLVLGCLLAIAFLTQTSEQYSRQVLALWAVGALAGQHLLYIAAQALSKLWRSHADTTLATLVVGSGELAQHLTDSINRNPFLAERVIGIVDLPRHTVRWTSGSVPVLGLIEDLPSLIASSEIDRVYVALPVERSAEIAEIQRMLLDFNVDVIWAPDIFSFNLLNHCVREVAGVPLISLSESPLNSGGRAIVKTMLDVTVAGAALLWFAPVMLAIALAIKLTSTGPVIFRQKRHGWDGSVFEVWKFRTMYVHEEAGKVTPACRGDRRITPFGRLLRRSSLDELPQLFNVLGGTMSLVGPRPHAVVHNLEYSRQISAYMARHRVKPGITGWAQVHGYRGETETLDKMAERVRLDLEYINSWSLSLDIWILIRTPFALFSENAY